MRIKHRLTGLILAAVFASVLFVPGVSHAAVPYEGYQWNRHDSDVHSINGYIYQYSMDGYDLESGPFKEPQDLFVAPDGTIFVADTGNNRIVHLSMEMKVLGVIGDAEGKGALSEPKGVFVHPNGTIYVADTKNQRIVLFSPNGKYVKEYTVPKSPLLGKNFTYSPSKLTVDKREVMMVVSEGNTQGLLQIDKNGQFKGFFGANHIGFSWKRLLVNTIATDDQKAQLAVQRPLEFSSVTQDEEGSLYTTTLGTETNQIKRLSPVGVDTLNPGREKRYGDRYDVAGPFELSSFVSISVSPEGFISALDLNTSKVFEYDKLGNLLFVYGGLGDQSGLFKTPADIAGLPDGSIAVLDKGRNRIDVFRTTPFADLVHKASILYVDGRYQEAESMWKEVLKYNANYDMAYHAIGKSLYKGERYGEAMRYFKLAETKGDYSTAFKEYRKAFMREHFAWFAGGLILLILVLRYAVPLLLRFLRRVVTARMTPGASRAESTWGKGESP